MLERGEAVYTILEHVPMHHETFRYMLHRLPYQQKRAAPQPVIPPSGRTPRNERIRIPAGKATLGADRDELVFGWDNEFEKHLVEAPTSSPATRFDAPDHKAIMSVLN